MAQGYEPTIWEGILDLEAGCVHCKGAGEDRVWQDDLCRVVLVHGTSFDGWCHVIFNRHVAELGDVSKSERDHLIGVVVATENSLKRLLSPRKINVASLGTAAPHLHFHVIPRFEDDPAFPAPVWSPPIRTSTRTLPPNFADQLKVELGKALAGSGDM